VKHTALVAFCATVTLGACNDVPPVASYAVVAGRVYDAASGAPLAGVTVTVDTVDVATTASDGTYRIVNVPPGPTDIAVDAPPGYRVGDPSQLTFSVRAGELVQLDVPLSGT
jgi:hypothetical protein